MSDPSKMSPDALLGTARSSLECFGLAMMPGFESAPHHKLIIEKVERLLRAKTRKLAIIVPPRHGKSTLCSILLPAYFIGRNPSSSVICTSYGAELSEGFGRRVRNILASPLFATIFPTCRLSPDSTAMHRFNTTANGEAVFAGRGGALTGRGAELLILDDLVKDSEEARSEIVCKSVIDWLQQVAFTRLTPNGKVIAIATRWSERDPMGWLLQQKGWDVLHLPAVSEGDRDPLNRPEGAPLWPSQFPLHVLQAIRESIGGSAFESLYQGNPTAAQGQIFKREWLRTYRETPSRFTKIVQSWDCAFKTGRENDFSVCSTWGATDSGFYLLSLWRGRVEFPELKKQVTQQADAWRPHAVLVEDTASGQSLVQELRGATTFPVIAVKVDSDKVTRASAVTAYFESGRVFFPELAPWLADLEGELCAFPGGAHDDCVDSISQALNYLRGGSRIVLGFVDLLKNLASGVTKLFSPKTPAPTLPIVSTEKMAAPDSCWKCGNRGGFVEYGTGSTAKYRCSRCGHYTDAVAKEEEPITAPCSCHAPLQSVAGQLRCSQCGVQFWKDGPPAIYTGPNRTTWLAQHGGR